MQGGDVTSLVYEDPSAGAGTHAIVIGVGRYPHLPGGGGTPNVNVEQLGQLSSSATSARAIATWLLTRHAHATAPLKSLHLLLSEANPAPFEWTSADGAVHSVPVVAGATWAEVDAAVRDWAGRANSHPDNQTIFHFCGHGLGDAGEVALLLEDFMGDPLGGLSGMLDIRALRLAMRRSQARKQVWFLDACRVPSRVLAASEGFLGESPLSPGFGGVGAWHSPQFHSTIQGAAAFGRPNRPSMFTEALIQALEGGGCEDINLDGRWHVTPTHLHAGLAIPLRLATRTLGALQINATSDLTEDFTIHTLPGPPLVPVFLACAPDEAMEQAELSCTDPIGTKQSRPPDPEPWGLTLPPASYRFDAAFSSGTWQPVGRDVAVRPPSRELKLQVS